VLAPFDYGKLDRDGQKVRIRLDSTCVDVRNDHALADLAARLKNLRGTLFARVLIFADEPPRVLPLRDGAEIKSRFRAALGVKA